MTPEARSAIVGIEVARANLDGTDGKKSDEWLHKHMPPPARLAWRWIGKPKYERHRAALEGR